MSVRWCSKGKWKEGEERLKRSRKWLIRQVCTCIVKMLWLMHNTWWLYIQFVHIGVMLWSCSPCLLTVSSKCYVFRWSPCLWVQYNMLLPADTFSFPPVSHFFTTSFCPFVTRSKRVLVHTRRKVKKKCFPFNEKTNSANRFHTKFISC